MQGILYLPVTRDLQNNSIAAHKSGIHISASG